MTGGTLRELDNLLVAQATEGLTAREAGELARLLAAHPEVDAQAYERAAAAVTLAALGAGRELPATLRAKLERGAASLAPPGSEG